MNAYAYAYAIADRREFSTVSSDATVTRRGYVSATSPSRPPHRQRDFGVGYGTSSGYASDRSYVSRNVTPLFRCV